MWIPKPLSMASALSFLFPNTRIASVLTLKAYSPKKIRITNWICFLSFFFFPFSLCSLISWYLYLDPSTTWQYTGKISSPCSLSPSSSSSSHLQPPLVTSQMESKMKGLSTKNAPSPMVISACVARPTAQIPPEAVLLKETLRIPAFQTASVWIKGWMPRIIK